MKHHFVDELTPIGAKVDNCVQVVTDARQYQQACLRYESFDFGHLEGKAHACIVRILKSFHLCGSILHKRCNFLFFNLRRFWIELNCFKPFWGNFTLVFSVKPTCNYLRIASNSKLRYHHVRKRGNWFIRAYLSSIRHKSSNMQFKGYSFFKMIWH
jgi:hypothetical protein